MTRTLRTEGLLPPLFPVEGRLVEYYNRALKQVTGIETSLSSFTVDMRGKSPEIAEELGDDYLQVSDAHRFMIIVSPEQMDAGMLQSEFSIDSDAIRRHYDHFLSGISIVTRVDGLYSELQDFVRTYSNPGDVLGLREYRTTHSFGFYKQGIAAERRGEAAPPKPTLTNRKQQCAHSPALSAVSRGG